jgi:hypothetical protein
VKVVKPDPFGENSVGVKHTNKQLVEWGLSKMTDFFIE